jgi:hypothetical protein
LVQQLVAEIGSRRPSLQKRHPELKTTEGRPRKYYYTEKSDFAEVAAAESTATSTTVSTDGKTLGEHAMYPLLSLYLWKEYGVYSKRIDEKRSSNKRGPNGNRWLYPDVVGMSLDQARDHQQVKLANGWQFHFVLTKGKRSSDDEYDGGFNFFLIDEHGAFRSSKTFTKPKHILETDGGQTAYKLNTKSFAALSVRDWVIELQETYDVEAPDEVDGAAATYFSSYSNVFLVAIDKEAYEMTLALDSLQTGLVTGLAKPSSSSAVFWDKEERLQRILVPQKGKEFPNLLVRIRQCTSSRSKTSCADTGGYKKWKNEAIYGYRDGKYEKQSKKSE